MKRLSKEQILMLHSAFTRSVNVCDYLNGSLMEFV